MRHFLEIDDLTPTEIEEVLACSVDLDVSRVLDGKGMALLFEKPSLRTRNSMELAVAQLGGHPLTIRPDEVGLDTRETVEDVTRTLACFHAAIGARVFEHSKLERMAAVSTVPVVNLLSDTAHPMQALADLLTLREEFGDLSGRSITYVGDGNNVARSLALACGGLGMEVRIATPVGYEMTDTDLACIRAYGVDPVLTTDPFDAVAGTDAVYTDVWASMGQEAQAGQRREHFAGFTVNEELMGVAHPDAVFLHCLPAHRGEEVSHEVLEGSQNRVWRQAENRMHAARGLLAWLLSAGGRA
jgi:ornithine carbamoyltransferase